jgi:chromosome partitioning protein
VLIFDFDPQANSSAGLGVRVERSSTYDVVINEVPAADIVVETPIAGLWLAPANPGLAGADVELVPMLAREFRLKRALEGLRGAYDEILIDCPPSLGLLTVNALAAADEVIVPVQCEYLALEGLGQLTQTLELVRRNLNPSLRLRGLLLTMFDSRTNLSQQVADEVRKHFANTFKTVIPRSVRLSEAPSHGLPIAKYDPSSRANRAYDALADELIAGTRTEVHA